MTRLKQQGFLILYAVILVSIVLTISLSIFNIVAKQLILSFTVRDSQFSLLAADSIFDCIKYWDSAYKYGEIVAADNQPFGYFDDSNVFVIGNVNVQCGGASRESFFSQPSGNTTFKFELLPVGGKTACAEGVVRKYLSSPGNNERTTIAVHGYNAACGQIGSGGRVVQRTLMTDQ